jgi:hypothetical protein
MRLTLGRTSKKAFWIPSAGSVPDGLIGSSQVLTASNSLESTIACHILTLTPSVMSTRLGKTSSSLSQNRHDILEHCQFGRSWYTRFMRDAVFFCGSFHSFA